MSEILFRGASVGLAAGTFHLFAALTLNAAESERIVVGDRVRLSTSEFRIDSLVGTIAYLDEDSLVITDGRGHRHSLSLESLNLIEVSMGRPTRIVEGLVVGLVIGTGLGALIGATNSTSGWWFIPAIYLGAAGGGLGFAIGAATHGKEQWEEVHIDRLRLGVSYPPGQGIRMRVSVGF